MVRCEIDVINFLKEITGSICIITYSTLTGVVENLTIIMVDKVLMYENSTKKCPPSPPKSEKKL